MKSKTLPMVYCEYGQEELILSKLLEEQLFWYLKQLYAQGL